MKHAYIVHQVIVVKTNDDTLPIGTIVKKVYAESEPEAIGKFVLETQNLNVPINKRLEIICVKLSDLKTIK